MLRFPFGTISGMCATVSVSRLQRSVKCRLFSFLVLCKLYVVASPIVTPQYLYIYYISTLVVRRIRDSPLKSGYEWPQFSQDEINSVSPVTQKETDY